MENTLTFLTIAAVYAERRFFWNMINSITNMAAMEENISSEFSSLIGKMQENTNTLYLSISDTYHETREKLVKMGIEPEIYENRRLYLWI